MSAAIAGMAPHLLTEFTREELWHVTGDAPRLVRVRTELGRARTELVDGLLRIEASSDPRRISTPGDVEPRDPSILVTQVCDSDLRLREHLESVPIQPSMLLLVHLTSGAREIASRSGSSLRVFNHVAMELRTRWSALGMVCRFDEMASDLRRLAALGERPATRSDVTAPILWKEGSGAVLIHEAVGHASMAPVKPLGWPPWLEVIDDPFRPGLGQMELDDGGFIPRITRLHAGESPRSIRRQSFRDAPLRRMSNLIISQNEAPFELPIPRIEVHLVGGGDYDPLTDLVSLRVTAAEAVTHDGSSPILPFEIRERRSTIARSLIGARGEPRRYPGVFCSDEGQRLTVGSWCCELLTAPLERQ